MPCGRIVRCGLDGLMGGGDCMVHLLAAVLLCSTGCESCSGAPSDADGSAADTTHAPDVPAAFDLGQSSELGEGSESGAACVAPGERCITEQECCGFDGTVLGAHCLDGACGIVELP